MTKKMNSILSYCPIALVYPYSRYWFQIFTYESFSECYLFRFRIGFIRLVRLLSFRLFSVFRQEFNGSLLFCTWFDDRFFEFFIIWITNRTSITIAISLRCNNFVYEIHYLEIKCIWKLYLIDKPASFIGATVVEMVVLRCLASTTGHRSTWSK